MVEELHSGARQVVGSLLLSGALLLVGAFFFALRGTAVAEGLSDISAKEAANYPSDRFAHEPDLWRVQLRTMRALLVSIDDATSQGDAVAATVAVASRCFLAGLLCVGLALAILVSVVSF
jgi:hypothetical protein